MPHSASYPFILLILLDDALLGGNASFHLLPLLLLMFLDDAPFVSNFWQTGFGCQSAVDKLAFGNNNYLTQICLLAKP